MERRIRNAHELKPDLIILDEAQRIRNWTTATARTIKQLKSRYAFVLTGTPLENKLEELFSVVEFVDGRRLGPAFRFVHEHRVVDENGRLQGYRGLDTIHQQLAPILLRRIRQEVLKELPERTDQVFRVPLTSEQAEPYYEQSDILAALMRKWERQGWLSEIDQKRILCCIQNMRMLCNSTFLFDKQTHHSPKLQEFREILIELAIEENRKVVVFSEYERMTLSCWRAKCSALSRHVPQGSRWWSATWRIAAFGEATSRQLSGRPACPVPGGCPVGKGKPEAGTHRPIA